MIHRSLVWFFAGVTVSLLFGGCQLGKKAVTFVKPLPPQNYFSGEPIGIPMRRVGLLPIYNDKYPIEQLRVLDAAFNAELTKKSIFEVSLTRQSSEDESGTKEREFADDGISPYRALKNKQLSAAIDVAVAHLPVDYRELIQLRHFAELSYEEIASMKKLPLGTVKNKLFRARNLLKEALDSFVEPL